MERDDREGYDLALDRARRAAYRPGEFVGQESFMEADEILALALHAGIGVGVRVLDLCCGVAGPGRHITAELGCTYLGVDRSATAIDLAVQRSDGLRCRFEVAPVPPLPPGPFDVVLLLETMLAFPDKKELLGAVAGVLPPGGRFAFTVEEGAPLDDGERALMPDADTVWLVGIEELTAHLVGCGFRIVRLADHSADHRRLARRLLTAYRHDSAAIGAAIGEDALKDLLDSHALWSQWLQTGRVRKFAVVAEFAGPASALPGGRAGSDLRPEPSGRARM